LESREEARSCSHGDLLLCFCEDCGFIANYAFDPALTEYSERYEETQAFSGTFSEYSRTLALELIERHDLRGKRIIEIGCGKGDFLALLCELGNNDGIGFDPGFREDRAPRPNQGRIRFITDYYSEAYSELGADFYCSKMTLEHIPEVGSFMDVLQRTTRDRTDATIFFQVPEAARILEEGLFCDVPYEHCSYFAPASLAALFRRKGFDVANMLITYEGQHLAVEARPGPSAAAEDDLEELERLVDAFAERCADQVRGWVKHLEAAFEDGQRVVLWGSGSKSTAFLTTLGIESGIDFVVDINPYRQGKYMAGTGQQIVSPDFLKTKPPDLVIIMNPIYRDEIGRTLADLGLTPQILTLLDVPQSRIS
jgi:hypothetical protein